LVFNRFLSEEPTTGHSAAIELGRIGTGVTNFLWGIEVPAWNKAPSARIKILFADRKIIYWSVDSFL
jgi:hypothetical protein